MGYFKYVVKLFTALNNENVPSDIKYRELVIIVIEINNNAPKIDTYAIRHKVSMLNCNPLDVTEWITTPIPIINCIKYSSLKFRNIRCSNKFIGRVKIKSNVPLKI